MAKKQIFINGLTTNPNRRVSTTRAFGVIRKAIKETGTHLSGNFDLTDKTNEDMFSFVVYHMHKDDFVAIAIEDFREDDRAVQDIQRLRSEALVDLLEEIFASEKSKVKSIKDAVEFVSMDNTNDDLRYIWTKFLGNLKKADEGVFGEDAAIMSASFLNSVPLYRAMVLSAPIDSPRCHKDSLVYLEDCLLPFRSHLFNRMLNQSKASKKTGVKDLANRMSRETGLKISEIYEFLAKIAGEPTWNNLSAKLKD